MRKRFGIVGVTFVLAGCASEVPLPIRTPLPNNLTPDTVRANAGAYLGTRVRWGGAIVSVENRASDTLVGVLARPLDRDGRPRQDQAAAGRFLARVHGFLDPAVYEEGREFTVVGTVDGTATRNIGAYPYLYPVVKAESYYLWEPLPPLPRYLYDPFWCDPWYPTWRAWWRYPCW